MTGLLAQQLASLSIPGLDETVLGSAEEFLVQGIVSYAEDGKLQKTPWRSCDSKAVTAELCGERVKSGLWPHIMRVWYHPHQLHGCLVNTKFSLRMLSLIKDHRVLSCKEQRTNSYSAVGCRFGSALIHFNASTLIRE